MKNDKTPYDHFIDNESIHAKEFYTCENPFVVKFVDDKIYLEAAIPAGEELKNLKNLFRWMQDSNFLNLNMRIHFSSAQSLSVLKKVAELSFLNSIKLNIFNLSKIPKELLNIKKIIQHISFRVTAGKIPEELFQLTNMKSLNLSDNHLTEIPDEISKLTNLEVLILNNNQLKDLPESLGNLKKIKRLYLDLNLFEKLPDCIFTLTNLEKIYFRGNPVILHGNPNTNAFEKIFRRLYFELPNFQKFHFW